MFRVSDFHNISESVREKAAEIKAVITDVDGVLTNGTITYTSDGVEIKSFFVQDGLGAKLLIENNIILGVITGRSSEVVNRRCSELGINEVHQGIVDKGAVLLEICKKYQFKPSEIAYIGDDINDWSAMEKVGLKVCPADAHQLIKRQVDYITWKKGGSGAFRELADLILTAKNHWNKSGTKYSRQ